MVPMHRMVAPLSLILIIGILFMAPRSICAEEVPPTDPIARAEVLLREYPEEVDESQSDSYWKSHPHLEMILFYIKEPPPRVPDTSIITRFRRLFEHADLSLGEQTESLLAMARWQRSAGMNKESMVTVRSALSTAHSLYPPDADASSNLADRIAKLLIQWEGETEEIISAIDLSLRVHSQMTKRLGWHKPPGYGFLAAQEKRHDLVDKLVGQARHPRDSAMALAQAATGYEKVGDAENAVAAARRSITILEQISTEDLPRLGAWDDWRIRLAESLSRLNQRELAREVMANIERGNDISENRILVAGAWLRIGEDREANRRFDQHIEEIEQREVDPDDRSEPLNQAWWMMLMSYVERGDFTLAEEMIPKFPETSAARLDSLNWIARNLLERGDDRSKQMVRDLYRRHASIVEKVEILTSTRFNADLNELYYAAVHAAQAGALDVVEKHYWPKMTADQRKRVWAFLVMYSTEMPLDERIQRYVTPLTDPSLRANYFCSIGGGSKDDQVIRCMEEMVLKETQCPAWDMGRYLGWLISHRQSLGHWDRAREMSQHALAAAMKSDNPRYRVRLIQEATLFAWVCGYEEVARVGAETMVDVLWKSHLQKSDDFSSEDFRTYAQIAKGMLGATKDVTPDLSPK